MHANIPNSTIPLMKHMRGPKVGSMNRIDVNEKKTRRYHTQPTSSKVCENVLRVSELSLLHLHHQLPSSSRPFPSQTHCVFKHIHRCWKVWHSSPIGG